MAFPIGERMCAIANPSESLSVDFSPFEYLKNDV